MALAKKKGGLGVKPLLHRAALFGDEGLLARSLDSSDVNGRDRYGNTPLHFASAKGRVEVIRSLLRAGAEIDAASPDGTTALMAAARWGKAKAAEELLRRGADPMTKDRHGRTALDVVAGAIALDESRAPTRPDSASPLRQTDQLMALLHAQRPTTGHSEIQRLLLSWIAAAQGGREELLQVCKTGAVSRHLTLPYCPTCRTSQHSWRCCGPSPRSWLRKRPRWSRSGSR